MLLFVQQITVNIILEVRKMENIVTEILAMVEKILVYFQEGEAAGVIEIIKNSLGSLLGGLGL